MKAVDRLEIITITYDIMNQQNSCNNAFTVKYVFYHGPKHNSHPYVIIFTSFIFETSRGNKLA